MDVGNRSRDYHWVTGFEDGVPDTDMKSREEANGGNSYTK